MSSADEPFEPWAEQLSDSIKAHSFRFEELRCFFKKHKIKVTSEQKKEFNEILDSLDSILISTAFKRSARLATDSISKIFKEELSTMSDRIVTNSADVNNSRFDHSKTSAPIQPALPKSYSDAVKSVKGKNFRSNNPKNVYLNKKNVLFVKKKQNTIGEDITLSEVGSLLDKDPTVKVNKIFDNENNVKIISHDLYSSNKIKTYLENTVGLDVSEKAHFDPCIAVTGVPRDLKDEFLLRELSFRNGAPESRTKIIRKFKYANSNFTKVILRSSPDFRDSVLGTGRIFIGSSSFHVEDYVHIIKCFKCQRFGHVMNSCTHDTTCGLCSESHLTRDVPGGKTPINVLIVFGVIKPPLIIPLIGLSVLF